MEKEMERWLEGLVEQADKVDAIKQKDVKILYDGEVEKLLGYISSARFILKLK